MEKARLASLMLSADDMPGMASSKPPKPLAERKGLGLSLAIGSLGMGDSLESSPGIEVVAGSAPASLGELYDTADSYFTANKNLNDVLDILMTFLSTKFEVPVESMDIPLKNTVYSILMDNTIPPLHDQIHIKLFECFSNSSNQTLLKSAFSTAGFALTDSDLVSLQKIIKNRDSVFKAADFWYDAKNAIKYEDAYLSAIFDEIKVISSGSDWSRLYDHYDLTTSDIETLSDIDASDIALHNSVVRSILTRAASALNNDSYSIYALSDESGEVGHYIIECDGFKLLDDSGAPSCFKDAFGSGAFGRVTYAFLVSKEGVESGNPEYIPVVLKSQRKLSDATNLRHCYQEISFQSKLSGDVDNRGVLGCSEGFKIPEGNLLTVAEMAAGDLDLSKVSGTDPKVAFKESLITDKAAFKALAKQCAQSLAFIHQKGIIHRDFKPANLLMGFDRTIRLADFGLATRSESDKKTGTERYLPFYSEPQTAKTDVFMLGVSLMELGLGLPIMPAAYSTFPSDLLGKFKQVLESDKSNTQILCLAEGSEFGIHSDDLLDIKRCVNAHFSGGYSREELLEKVGFIHDLLVRDSRLTKKQEFVEIILEETFGFSVDSNIKPLSVAIENGFSADNLPAKEALELLIGDSLLAVNYDSICAFLTKMTDPEKAKRQLSNLALILDEGIDAIDTSLFAECAFLESARPSSQEVVDCAYLADAPDAYVFETYPFAFSKHKDEVVNPNRLAASVDNIKEISKIKREESSVAKMEDISRGDT